MRLLSPQQPGIPGNVFFTQETISGPDCLRRWVDCNILWEASEFSTLFTCKETITSDWHVRYLELRNMACFLGAWSVHRAVVFAQCFWEGLTRRWAWKGLDGESTTYQEHGFGRAMPDVAICDGFASSARGSWTLSLIWSFISPVAASTSQSPGPV